MSDDIKGVFVRLPLSDAQRELMVDAAAFGQPDDSQDKTLISIGTHVTGGDLPTEVFRIREHRKDIELPWTYHKVPPSEQDIAEYELEVDRMLTHKQALSKLAEKDTEIARYREAMEEAREYARKGSWSRAHVALHKALKGPEE